jgi:hypothetical protein
MSEDHQSVGRWLQSAGTYSDPDAPAPGTGWREALLLTVAEDAETAAAARQAAAREPESAPLRMRHLVMLSPAGAALFGLGWWVGRGGVSAQEIAAVPAGVWVACAAAVAAIALLWHGVPLVRIGRGR